MRTIVFVSDEVAELARVERLVRALFDGYEVRCFSEPERALADVCKQPTDIVVADLSTSSVTSADFLALVRDVQPASARVMLAPFGQDDDVAKSTRVAHQFLPKPCDVRSLRTLVERLERCRNPSSPQAICDIVAGVDELPALGTVYSELVREMNTESSSSESLGAIVSKDVALTAQLLRMVNSSYFGLSVDITSVAHAIGFLGFDVVRAIVVGHALFDHTIDPVVDVRLLAARARLASALARQSVQRDGGSSAESAEAFLAAMLHEVGSLVLARVSDVDENERTLALASHDLMLDRLTFGIDRFDVGGELLGLWGFDDTVVEAVAGLSLGEESINGRLGRAVRLAHSIVRSTIELSGELTEVQLQQLLDAAEADALIDFEWEAESAA